MSTAMQRAAKRTRARRAWVSPVMGMGCLVAALAAAALIDWPLGLVAAIPLGFMALYLILAVRVKRGS